MVRDTTPSPFASSLRSPLSPTLVLAAGPITRDQALRFFECCYTRVDGALSALASGVKRMQAATQLECVRTLV